MSHAVYLPFFPVWLESRGLSAALIGIIVAIPILVRILATTPLMGLADGSFGVRRLLLISHAGQIFGFPLLILTGDDGVTIAVLVALIAIAQVVIIPGNDLVSTNAVKRYADMNYGRIRGAGSVAFFLANIAAGYLIGWFGADVVPVALAFIPLLAIGATLMAVPHETPARAENTDGASLAPLPKALWLIMIAAALTQGTHGALYAFGSIHWRASGFSDATIGYFWGVGVLAEILVFIIVGRAVGRGSGIGLILIGSAGAVVRFVGLALDLGLAATFALQVMHCLSFAATFIGTMAALTALSPPGARGRVQGICTSLAALTMAVTTALSGVIYKEVGALVFAAVAPLGAIGFIVALMAVPLLKAQAHDVKPDSRNAP